MNQTEQRNAGVETLIVGLLIAGTIFGLIVWAGAQLATLVAEGRSLPATAKDTAAALIQLKDHLGNPREAWAPALRDQLPGPILYWAASGLVLLAGGAVGDSDGSCSGARRMRSTVGSEPASPPRVVSPGRRSSARSWYGARFPGDSSSADSARDSSLPRGSRRAAGGNGVG